MSFLERQMLKAESKLNHKYMSDLIYEAPDFTFVEVDVSCTAIPGGTHKAIRATSSSGAKYFFHRCKQVWFLGKNEHDLSAEYLTKQNPGDKSTHGPLILAVIYHREAAHYFGERISRWSEWAFRFGLDSEPYKDKFSDLCSEALEDTRQMGAFAKNQSGSKWLQGEEPGTKTEYAFNRYLETVGLDGFTKLGVQMSEITGFWDKTPFEMELVRQDVEVAKMLSVIAITHTPSHKEKTYTGLDEVLADAKRVSYRIFPQFASSIDIFDLNRGNREYLPIETFERYWNKFLFEIFDEDYIEDHYFDENFDVYSVLMD